MKKKLSDQQKEEVVNNVLEAVKTNTTSGYIKLAIGLLAIVLLGVATIPSALGATQGFPYQVEVSNMSLQQEIDTSVISARNVTVDFGEDMVNITRLTSLVIDNSVINVQEGFDNVTGNWTNEYQFTSSVVVITLFIKNQTEFEFNYTMLNPQLAMAAPAVASDDEEIGFPYPITITDVVLPSVEDFDMPFYLLTVKFTNNASYRVTAFTNGDDSDPYVEIVSVTDDGQLPKWHFAIPTEWVDTENVTIQVEQYIEDEYVLTGEITLTLEDIETWENEIFGWDFEFVGPFWPVYIAAGSVILVAGLWYAGEIVGDRRVRAANM